MGVLFENGVQDGIRNLVGHLVRMALGHGFRSKYMKIGHKLCLIVAGKGQFTLRGDIFIRGTLA